MEERNHLQEAAEWLAAYEDYSTSNYSPEAAYRMAQLRIGLALAEATRPRFVRLGDHTINVAHIAYVDWYKFDHQGDRMIEITFCAINNTAALGLVFRGDEVAVVEPVLRAVLEPLTVVAVDFPEKQETEPSDAAPFTVIN